MGIPGGIPSVYSYSDLLRGGAKSLSQGEYDGYDWLHQVGPTDYWTGNRGGSFYGGIPPRYAFGRHNTLIVADLKRPLAYAIARDMVTAVALDGQFADVASRRVRFESANQYMIPGGGYDNSLLSNVAAVTQDDQLFLFYRNDSGETLYRAELPAFSQQPVIASDDDNAPARFSLLPTDESVTAMSISEDGATLILAHEKANAITAWDVKSGSFLQRKACPSPHSILCRGGRVYVANAGKGTIGVFNTAGNWKMEDELAVGAPNINWLSAAQGDQFHGKILAWTTDGTYLVDANRDEHIHVHSNNFLGSMDYAGQHVIDITRDSQSATSIDLSSYLQHKNPVACPHEGVPYPFLYQVHEGDLWMGGRGVYIGVPPQKLRDDMGIMIVADRSAELVYALTGSDIVARRANAGLAQVGERPLIPPTWLASYEWKTHDEIRAMPAAPRLPAWTGFSSDADHTNINNAHSQIAVTLDGKTHFYLIHPAAGAVYRCVVPAFKTTIGNAVNPTKPASIVAALSPAKNNEMVDLPTNEPVTTFAVDEEFETVILAHEKANQLSILSLKDGKLLTTISCPAPRSILCRGGKILVANYNRATVTCLDPHANWARTTINVGIAEVFYLSAPTGQNFKGEVIATCGKRGNRDVVLIDINRGEVSHLSHRENLGAVTSDALGTVVLEQDEFIQTVMGAPRAYDYASYVHGNRVPIGESPRRYGPLMQVRRGPLWFDGGVCAAGSPPQLVLGTNDGARAGDEQHGLVVPDMNADLYYTIGADHIMARKADGASTICATHQAVFPKWAAAPSEIYSRPTNADSKEVPRDVIAQPVAVSLGSQLYVLAVHDQVLERFEGDSFVTDAGTPPDPTQAPGPILVFDASPWLARLRDGSGILFLQGRTLTILDAEGARATRMLQLDASYRKILDRPDYFVALGRDAVDLLDKKTGKVLKHIEIAAAATCDLTLHPTSPVCYVSAVDGSFPRLGGQLSELPRIYEVDEKTGTARDLRHAYGRSLQLDASGEILLALRPALSVTTENSWELGTLARLNGRLDFLVSYSLSPGRARFRQGRNLGMLQTTGIAIAPEGETVSLVGAESYGHLPEIKADDLGRAVSDRFTSLSSNLSVDYSPASGHVAVADNDQLQVFDRANGRLIEGALSLEPGQLKKPFEAALFTPSGKHLLVVATDSHLRRRVLQTISLAPEAFKVESAKPIVMLDQPRPVVPLTDPAVHALPAAEKLQALAPVKQATKTDKQVAEESADGVVMVGGFDPNATGFFVGADGYAVTCASAIQDGEHRAWVRSARAGHVDFKIDFHVEIVRIDEDRDLALLKIDAHDVRVLHLAEALGDPGDAVSTLGHSGAIRPFSDYTLSNGILSGPVRMLHGIPYLQTTAAISGVSIGSPLFNDRGEVIGVIARRSANANTSFAIPLTELRDFLRDCIQAPAKAPEAPPK